MPASRWGVDETPRTPAKQEVSSTTSSTDSAKRTFPNARMAVVYLEQRHGEMSRSWTYRDINGTVAGMIVRWDRDDVGKKFRPIAPHNDGWAITAMPRPRPLYRLNEVREALANGCRTVLVVEGEGVAECGQAIIDAIDEEPIVTVTTWAGGSSSVEASDWSVMAVSGLQVVIIPDHDDPGRKAASTLTRVLERLSPRPLIKITQLADVWPDVPEGGDLLDYADAHDAMEPHTMLDNLLNSAKTSETVPSNTIPTEFVPFPVEVFPEPNPGVAPDDRSDEQVVEEKAIRFRAAPIGGERARIEYCPIPITELECDENIDWLWEGYIARDHVTLFVGIWKGGKTTLLAHLLKAMEDGGELGGDVSPCKILVVTEEGKGHWARRRDKLDIGSHLSIVSRPFKGRPTQNDWEMLIDMIAKDVKQIGFDLVVIDSWQAVNPCQDENDAADTMAALAPLSQLSEAGAAVLLVHHPKKGDAGQGQASRGSGALTGWVDTIVELRRFSTSDNRDRRRVLQAYGRFDETPDQVVVELTDDGYTCVGTAGDAKQSDRLEVIAEILDSDWRTREDIRDRWPVETIPKPGTSTLRTDLNAGFEAGKWERQGKGRKGDPFVYRFVSRTLPPLREENETEFPVDDEESGDGATDDRWGHPGAA
jgi:KaiC/GvpD/RAD55 family RecA-like ATPase